ncbi:hypothetical protein VTK56DRAFT_2642 [Thermocarpiscus australiensis]
MAEFLTAWKAGWLSPAAMAVLGTLALASFIYARAGAERVAFRLLGRKFGRFGYQRRRICLYRPWAGAGRQGGMQQLYWYLSWVGWEPKGGWSMYPRPSLRRDVRGNLIRNKPWNKGGTFNSGWKPREGVYLNMEIHPCICLDIITISGQVARLLLFPPCLPRFVPVSSSSKTGNGYIQACIYCRASSKTTPSRAYSPIYPSSYTISDPHTPITNVPIYTSPIPDPTNPPEQLPDP